jgi:NitT/TauT family transport system permease protein
VRPLKRKGMTVLLPCIGLAIGWGIWEMLIRIGASGSLIAEAFAPGPSLEALYHQIREGVLLYHAGVSLRRVLIGLGLAAGVGMPLGLAIGYFASLERITVLLFQFLRTVSPLSWMPIAVIALGIGDRAVIFLIAIASVWPILLNTASGVRHLNRSWLWLARSVGASTTHILIHVAIPAIGPQLFTGLRMAVGIAWVVLVPAEMLGVSSGLGYYLLDTRDRLSYSELMAAILGIGVVGLLLDVGIRSLEARWRRLREEQS